MAGNRAHNGSCPRVLIGSAPNGGANPGARLCHPCELTRSRFHIGKNMKPNRHRTASKLASGKGNAPASHVRVSKLRTLGDIDYLNPSTRLVVNRGVVSGEWLQWLARGPDPPGIGRARGIVQRKRHDRWVPLRRFAVRGSPIKKRPERRFRMAAPTAYFAGAAPTRGLSAPAPAFGLTHHGANGIGALAPPAPSPRGPCARSPRRQHPRCGQEP